MYHDSNKKIIEAGEDVADVQVTGPIQTLPDGSQALPVLLVLKERKHYEAGEAPIALHVTNGVAQRLFALEVPAEPPVRPAAPEVAPSQWQVDVAQAAPAPAKAAEPVPASVKAASPAPVPEAPASPKSEALASPSVPAAPPPSASK